MRTNAAESMSIELFRTLADCGFDFFIFSLIILERSTTLSQGCDSHPRQLLNKTAERQL
jgi:hypothetical protein